ncbi:MAG: hypothetical protein ACR2RF_19120 [Geminicoccaceae bacterium]
MIHTLAILVPIVALTVGAIQAAAETPVPVDGLQIDGTLDAISNSELVDAIITAAPTKPAIDFDELAIEPSAAADGESDWTEKTQSGVGYPVTPTIFLGVAYVHEEIEDLTAQHIEMGTAGVDYSSHKVLVRAHWQFGVLP